MLVWILRSEARMNPDSLTLVSDTRLKELLDMAQELKAAKKMLAAYVENFEILSVELKAARVVVEAARLLHRSVDYGSLPNHKHHDDLSTALRKLDEARRG
jgi:hypothetical protein